MRPSVQPFLWKWVWFAWEWKIISISKAEHLTSFWYRGPGELGNGLFNLTSEKVLATMLSDSYFCQTRSLDVVSAPNLIVFSFFNSLFSILVWQCVCNKVYTKGWRNKYSFFIVATEGGKNQPHIPSAKRKNGTFTRSRLVDLELFQLCRSAGWRWCYTRRFATTIFSAMQRGKIAATLFRMVTTYCSNTPVLCCAENCCCESSRVTSP